jgi:hypothetical protein
VGEIEDDIGRVMAEHDDEAPGTADLLGALGHAAWPRRRRARWYAPLSAGLAIAAVAVGSIWVGQLIGNHRQAGPKPNEVGGGVPLTCPSRYAGDAPWVPAEPTRVNGRPRLVPRRTPSSALVCAYAGSNTAKEQAGWALSGQRLLTGGLADLAGQLAWQPRVVPGQDFPCTLMGGPQTNYLIGLTYRGGGGIWVAATEDPNVCVHSSNGEFTSFGVIGSVVTRAFGAGRWPAPAPASCTGSGPGAGRLGQETAMVPSGSRSLIICVGHPGSPGRDRGEIDAHTSGYQALVSALNQLPTRLSTRGCSNSSGPSSPSYHLLFSYARGPAVLVLIHRGCHPEIDNLSLQSDNASSIIPLIRQLLTTK